MLRNISSNKKLGICTPLRSSEQKIQSKILESTAILNKETENHTI